MNIQLKVILTLAIIVTYALHEWYCTVKSICCELGFVYFFILTVRTHYKQNITNTTQITTCDACSTFHELPYQLTYLNFIDFLPNGFCRPFHIKFHWLKIFFQRTHPIKSSWNGLIYSCYSYVTKSIIHHKGSFIKDVRAKGRGGVTQKQTYSKGGCVNSELQIKQKCGQGQ